MLDNPRINALSVGVYKDGKKYTEHFGELDKGQGNTPSNRTLYEIASVTKTFTGALVAKAVLDKKLNLEDDIRQHLPEDFTNFVFDNKPITIKHLITHTSGLPRFLPVEINTLFDTIDENLPFRIDSIEQRYGKKQFLQDLKSYEINTVPGSSYTYSNADTELLAFILERAYGQTFESLIQNYICDPAKMTDTKIILTGEDKKRLANGYGEINQPVPHFANPLWGAGAGLKSTAADLVNYMQFQLDPENNVARESQRALYTDANIQIGYLWEVFYDSLFDVHYIIHGGAYGAQNMLVIAPKYNLGVWVITNQSGPETQGILWLTINDLLVEISKL